MINANYLSLSIRAQCRLLGVNRSTFYYEEVPLTQDSEIANRIIEIYEKTPSYGYRRIHAQLVREGAKINHKKVQSLMQEMRLKALYPKPRTTIKGAQSKIYPYLLCDLKIERVHQVWQVDITYLKLPGGFMYLTAIIDVYSRFVVSWRLSSSLCKESALEALDDAIWRYGVPEIMNSDQGSQFTSQEWEKICIAHEIKISMSHQGGSTGNAYVERFWRTLKYEGFYLNLPQTVQELKEELVKFIRWYNEERLHSSLDYCPPLEVLSGFSKINSSKALNFQAYGYADNSNELSHIPTGSTTKI